MGAFFELAPVVSSEESTSEIEALFPVDSESQSLVAYLRNTFVHFVFNFVVSLFETKNSAESDKEQ
ncbi:hypothetical protein PHLCEN_2v3330 [Hermanssonia centrifuga]|uniref:Uncharacterized protein n=1 Tax=Hermanssonia centrifuga TaxID=98765 RepID=A0A2R6QMA5_9APHY|nr:hypothetical protein PHLCEN_2v3330 [Hermanssonia centrifuga]